MLRLVVTFLFLFFVAILPLHAWLNTTPDALHLTNSAKGLHGITWSGTVRSDGRLSVRIDYDLDQQSHKIDVRMPDGARFAAVNGTPIAADIGRYGEATVTGPASVTYELPGAVTRYRDGAVLSLGDVRNGSIRGDQAMFPCALCYLGNVEYGDIVVSGALFVDGIGAFVGDQASAGLSFVNLSPTRAKADDDDVRFVGLLQAGDEPMMLATLPAKAVTKLTAKDGSVVDAVKAAKQRLGTDGHPFRSPTAAHHGSATVALVITVLYALLLIVILVPVLWARGARSAAQHAGAPDSAITVSSMKPGELSPALAGSVAGPSGGQRQSLVAAAILDLVCRNVISITGSDSRRFTIHVPATATGTTRFDRAVIEQLRSPMHPHEDNDIHVPPLWSVRGPTVARVLSKALAQEARHQRLIRATVPPVIAMPIPIAMGVIAIVGNHGASKLGYTTAIVGALLAFAASRANGMTLTTRGRAEQQRWQQYGAWLRSNNALSTAAAPDVATWGETLAYAAALGAASEVANELSPRLGS